MAEPLLHHYRNIAVTVKGNTSDEIYPQIEKEIVNRLGILPGAHLVNHTLPNSIITPASVSAYQKQLDESFNEEKLASSAQS